MDPSTHRYTPYYCEENVWQLCRARAATGREARVVFISNAARACAVWCQRAAPSPDEPVVWDYHVILLERDIERNAGRWQVWDLDTTLGVPIDFDDYLAATFRLSRGPHAPRFRVIDAAEYLARFASDRAHMRRPDGTWLQPPPSWPPIGAGAPSNLDALIDFGEASFGEVVSLAELRRRFGD